MANPLYAIKLTLCYEPRGQEPSTKNTEKTYDTLEEIVVGTSRVSGHFRLEDAAFHRHSTYLKILPRQLSAIVYTPDKTLAQLIYPAQRRDPPSVLNMRISDLMYAEYSLGVYKGSTSPRLKVELIPKQH
jgi:hypothetical protein